jgi:hypothetical protein
MMAGWRDYAVRTEPAPDAHANSATSAPKAHLTALPALMAQRLTLALPRLSVG